MVHLYIEIGVCNFYSMLVSQGVMVNVRERLPTSSKRPTCSVLSHLCLAESSLSEMTRFIIMFAIAQNMYIHIHDQNSSHCWDVNYCPCFGCLGQQPTAIWLPSPRAVTSPFYVFSSLTSSARIFNRILCESCFNQAHWAATLRFVGSSTSTAKWLVKQQQLGLPVSAGALEVRGCYTTGDVKFGK